MRARNIDELRSASVDEVISELGEQRQSSGCPSDLRRISFLMAALDTFRLLEILGNQHYLSEGWNPVSPQMKEIIRRLTAPENRTALRAWYVRTGKDSNVAALQFREYLERLVQEELGVRNEEGDRGQVDAGQP
jgi:hypothetical protein